MLNAHAVRKRALRHLKIICSLGLPSGPEDTRTPLQRNIEVHTEIARGDIQSTFLLRRTLLSVLKWVPTLRPKAERKLAEYARVEEAYIRVHVEDATASYKKRQEHKKRQEKTRRPKTVDKPRDQTLLEHLLRGPTPCYKS